MEVYGKDGVPGKYVTRRIEMALFDMENDPYETKNLIRDPAHQALRQQMETEFQRQKEAVGFRVPAYADPPAPATKEPG